MNRKIACASLVIIVSSSGQVAAEAPPTAFVWRVDSQGTGRAKATIPLSLAGGSIPTSSAWKCIYSGPKLEASTDGSVTEYVFVTCRLGDASSRVGVACIVNRSAGEWSHLTVSDAAKSDTIGLVCLTR